jgi:hypothetical protein
METTQAYASALRSSERVAWKLDDVLAEDAELDFSKSFLPEALVDAEPLPFLDVEERRILNQIRAHGYLCTFGLVEEFILPYIVDRLEDRAAEDLTEVRALLAFAGEEAKHIALFRRFREVFERGFGHRCEVIGPPSAIRDHVLAHSELGVGLLVLHIEWMTQRHYVELVRDRTGVEPSFRSLLHQHWLEESQHARIDGWIVESVAAGASEEERLEAFEDYEKLLDFLDDGLAQQVTLDLAAFEGVVGRSLSTAEQERFCDVQHRSQRRTYLTSGSSHPRVQTTAGRVHPAGIAHLERITETYS